MPVHASNCRGQSDKGVPTAFCRAGTQTMAFFFFFFSPNSSLQLRERRTKGQWMEGGLGGWGVTSLKKKKEVDFKVNV